jgi:phasin family protein
MTSVTIEPIVKANSEALSKSSTSAINGAQELSRVYQSLATKNIEKFNTAIRALSAVKTPVEFFELQQKLIKEGVESAIQDSQKIAELTSSVFSTAFNPLQKQIESLQKNAKF